MAEEWWSFAKKGNTYFKHISVHKCTRVARGREGKEIKSMIDLMLVKMDMLRYVQDVRAVRGMGRGWLEVEFIGVPGENDNVRRVVEICFERGLCVGNTYFEHKSLNKYTRMTKGQKDWR